VGSPDDLNRVSPLEALGRDIVERLGGEWRRGGGVCRCPAHDDRTPSLSVRPGERRLLLHCFAGCETGKVIRALVAMRLLGAQRAASSGEASRGTADRDSRKRGTAARLWAGARRLEGSPAEAYLRRRGLSLAVSDLRYHPRTPYGRGAEAIFRPALLAAVRDETGLAAVHRTFLDPRTARLADLALPKRALGRLGSGAVRLRAPEDGVLGWAEGIENAIAATLLFRTPCWATLGTERFARAALPPGVRRLILFLDNDAGGRRAETLARETQCGAGVEIEARYPEAAGADWNDVLLHRTPS
jgi:putative DNA primase/helicase